MYGDGFGLERTTALKAASVFGAGMGRLGEVCGAVTGALIVIGLKHGQTEPKDSQTKGEAYALVRSFADRFRTLGSTLLCRELLGCDLATPAGMTTARQKGYFTERCPRFVREVAEILEDVL